MKTRFLHIFTATLLLIGLSGGHLAAQDALDVSDKKLRKKEHLEDFYRSELRKGTLTDERRAEYTLKLTELKKEIRSIRKQRLANAESQKDTDPTLLEAETFDAQFRELDIALADSAPPMILANEPKSLLFNGGVSFLSIDKYSAPFTLSVEKVLSEKLSVGGYFGHFLEKVIDDELHLDSNAYFTSNKANYKHTYLNFGVRGSYHFFNPEFFLPPTKFDPYISAMLGYTIVTGTHPFLSNEEFLPYDESGNAVNPGEGNSAFLDPAKKGLNFGVFGGLRYMHDDHIGFFVEAGYANTAFGTIGVTVRFLDKNTTVGAAGQVVHFKVKIVSSERQKKPNSKAFKGREGVEEYKTKKEFVYVLSGPSTSFEDATNLQVELSGAGFRRAEVVAIKNGELIKLEKGKKLMGIVEEEPEVEEDPFKDDKKKKKEEEEEKEEKKKKKGKDEEKEEDKEEDK